jgi:ceramide glucosyltransferase
MRAGLRSVTSTLALGATLASIGYAAVALSRLHAFGRGVRRRAAPELRPTVTILKPARGLEPGLEENLRSFCDQDYPNYEVVIGVLDPDDPALDTIRRVAAAFAGRTTVVVGDGVARFANPKIATLGPMLEHAVNDVLVVADSDMRVSPDYLDAIVAPFADQRVGAVTCIYRGEPAANDLASALGAMWITEQFAPSALVANALEPLRYCFGATMAVRRNVLDEIGGLAALGDHLADDHALGRLVTQSGYRVALADYVVANRVTERDLRGMFEHEVRWARTIRTVRPSSYAGIVLTYPLPLALLYLAVARDRRRALAVAAAAVFVRLALRRAAHAELGTPKPPSHLLVMLRDTLGVAAWVSGLAGRTVRWRDDEFPIAAGGAIGSKAPRP